MPVGQVLTFIEDFGPQRVFRHTSDLIALRRRIVRQQAGDSVALPSSDNQLSHQVVL